MPTGGLRLYSQLSTSPSRGLHCTARHHITSTPVLTSVYIIRVREYPRPPPSTRTLSQNLQVCLVYICTSKIQEKFKRTTINYYYLVRVFAKFITHIRTRFLYSWQFLCFVVVIRQDLDKTTLSFEKYSCFLSRGTSYSSQDTKTKYNCGFEIKSVSQRKCSRVLRSKSPL